MRDIPNYESFNIVEPLNKGISKDQKYYVETIDGKRMLLRCADISRYDKKKVVFDMMKRVAALGIRMSRPIDFGVCNHGKSVYSLLTWCDGEDIETLMHTFSKAEQYALGVKAGVILNSIHSVSAPEYLDDWQTRFYAVNIERLGSYRACGIQVEGHEFILNYLEQNKHLLKGRPQCFHHGDYHTGNIIMDEGGTLSVIDWDCADFNNFGDPWQEFCCIGDIAMTYPHFATGQVNGYFSDDVPNAFWKILAFYMALGALVAVPWAMQYGYSMIEDRLNLCRNVLKWYDNMKNSVPTWYLKEIGGSYAENSVI